MATFIEKWPFLYTHLNCLLWFSRPSPDNTSYCVLYTQQMSIISTLTLRDNEVPSPAVYRSGKGVKDNLWILHLLQTFEDRRRFHFIPLAGYPTTEKRIGDKGIVVGEIQDGIRRSGPAEPLECRPIL